MYRLNYLLLAILFFSELLQFNNQLLSAEAQTSEGMKESWQRDLDYEEKMHITELIRGLDVPYQYRNEIIEKLVTAGMGKNKQIVESQLISALNFKNMQIRMGVVEIMLRIGNAHKFTTAIANMITYEPFSDVRIKVIRILPAFMISTFKKRASSLALLDAEDFSLTTDLREILRRPPIKSNSMKLDPKKARTRMSVINAITSQLDPIGTAINGLTLKNKQLEIKILLDNLTYEKFNGNIDDCIDKWLRIRNSAKIKDKDFIITVQSNACKMLSAIGGIEAWKQLIALSRVDRLESKIAAGSAFAELSHFSQEIWERDQSVLAGVYIYPDDIYNWNNFSSKIIKKNTNAYGSIIWEYLSTEAKLTITNIEKNKGTNPLIEISQLKKKTICDAINVALNSYDLLVKLQKNNYDDIFDKNEKKILNKRPEEIKTEEIAHLNRLIFENKFNYNVRHHKNWGRISEEEKIWRLKRQQYCKKLMASAYEFGMKTLESNSSSVVLRSYAYKTLGNCRKKEAVFLLYDWAARKEKDRSLLPEVCDALGEIGGIEAAKALSQLANFKGYSSSVTEIQREYRSVFSAFSALGAIAKRPEDSGGIYALMELARHLNDKRKIPGLPSIKKQALWQLRYAFQEGRENINPKEWLKVRENYLRKTNKNKRRSVVFKAIISSQ